MALNLASDRTSLCAATLTWTSTEADTCTGTGFDTANAASNALGVTVTPTETKTYSIACDGPGGSANAEATVTVIPKLAVSITATPTTGTVPFDVAFTSTPTGGTNDAYNRNFGDGATDTVQNPTHSYQAKGEYPVVLSVTSGTQTATATVTGNDPVTVTLIADQTTIINGQTVKLTWESAAATSCRVRILRRKMPLSAASQ